MKQLKKYVLEALALVALLGFAVASASPVPGQDKVSRLELKELIKNAKGAGRSPANCAVF